MSNEMISIQPPFIITKEYRRFAEFCDACRRHRYIGLCYGPPGVGKTLSARHYTRWDQIEPYLTACIDKTIPEDAADCRATFYTAGVENTSKRLFNEIQSLHFSLKCIVANAYANQKGSIPVHGVPPYTTELLLIDEADRLKMTGLELVRDMYDRGLFAGLILIGMPGIEKRLSRYPQLYSRVGFVHHYRPLGTEEMHFILEHQWQQMGLQFRPNDFTDAEAMAAMIRITGGNFRLIHRLCTQIERILQINNLHLITKEVVEAARENLVIGQF